MINYIKKTKENILLYFDMMSSFFRAVFNLKHKPIIEYTAVSREVVG